MSICKKEIYIVTPDYKAELKIQRQSTRDEYGCYIHVQHGCCLTVTMRTVWNQQTEDAVLADIELQTRRNERICWLNLKYELEKYQLRKWVGLPSQWTQEEIEKLYQLWYSWEARTMTLAFQFPLLKGQKSRQYPYGCTVVTDEKGRKEKVALTRAK